MKIVPMYPEPLKLKIHLEHTDIYRIVLVPSVINMLQLHLVCQEAMGWSMAHLFQFSDKKVNQNIIAGLPEFEEGFGFFGSVKEQKANEVKLSDFHDINSGKSFWYWYDFGDDWWHKISFQKPSKKDLELFMGQPLCVKGEKACPPENIGGISGYKHFLEILSKNIQADKDDILDFYMIEDENMYPDEFDLELTNEFLADIVDLEFWNMTADEFMDE